MTPAAGLIRSSWISTAMARTGRAAIPPTIAAPQPPTQTSFGASRPRIRNMVPNLIAPTSQYRLRAAAATSETMTIWSATGATGGGPAAGSAGTGAGAAGTGAGAAG